MTNFPRWNPSFAPDGGKTPPASGFRRIGTFPVWNPSFRSSNEQALIPLKIALSPGNIDGSGSDGTLYSQPITASVVSGEPDAVVSWSWTPVSSNDGVALSPNTPSTQFAHPNPGNGVTITRNWRVVARDQYGQTDRAEVYFGLTGTPEAGPSPPPLDVTVSPSHLLRSRSGAGSVTFSFAASVSGGSGSYTYSALALDQNGDAWANPSGGPVGMPTASFGVTLANGQVLDGTVYFNVTDTLTGATGSGSATWTAAAASA